MTRCVASLCAFVHARARTAQAASRAQAVGLAVPRRAEGQGEQASGCAATTRQWLHWQWLQVAEGVMAVAEQME